MEETVGVCRYFPSLPTVSHSRAVCCRLPNSDKTFATAILIDIESFEIRCPPRWTPSTDPRYRPPASSARVVAGIFFPRGISRWVGPVEGGCVKIRPARQGNTRRGLLMMSNSSLRALSSRLHALRRTGHRLLRDCQQRADSLGAKVKTKVASRQMASQKKKFR